MLKTIDQNIFSQLGLTNLPVETKKELLKAFTIAVWQAVALRISRTLNKEDQEKLIKLLELGSEEELGQFLQDKTPNIDAMVMEESLKFKQMLTERVKKWTKV